jgi:hypothetical protein
LDVLPARQTSRAFFRSGTGFHEMRKYPLFLFLFAVYPSLALLTRNFREVAASTVIRPLLFSILVACVVWILSVLLVRNWQKAVLIATSFLVLFFSFGHISLVVEGSNFAAALANPSQVINVLLLFATLFLLLFIYRMILKTKNDLSLVYQTLNVISLFLVLSSGFSILHRYLARQVDFPDRQDEKTQRSAAGPDVYYIILDAYGRQDSLKSLGYDNAAFIRELEEIGFYVPSCSRSNYPQTVLSMASALNLGYLWETIANQGSNDRNTEPVYAGIRNSLVKQEFEERGYRIVVFDSGGAWLHWRAVDQFVAPPARPLFSTQLDPFEYTFLDTTALHPLMTQPSFLRKKYVSNYERILFALRELPRIARSARPKFVYVHMLIPHRPNIFMPDGSMNLNTDYYNKGMGEGMNRHYDIEGYLNNTKFINSRLPTVIHEILRNSETTPIIIIQGDHGYQLPDIRFDILNAYYFPNRDYAALYPTITPVNTFRVVLNTYFDGDYPLLKDQSINVGINRPYGKKTMKPGECP